MSVCSLLKFSDNTALRHYRGATRTDCHGVSAEMNLVLMALKSFRLKIGSLRQEYNSPFGVFENDFGSVSGSRRFDQFSAQVGDFRNYRNAHSHKSYGLIKRVFEYFQFDTESYGHCDLANEGNLLLICFQLQKYFGD